MSILPTDVLAEAANIARGLAIDAVHKCSSGHLGLPLGSAEIGAALFGQALSYNPADPKWLNRDRFILSAGHGSMFLYSWLHLSGYDLSLKEVENFRGNWLGKIGCLYLELLSLGHAAGYGVKK